MITDQAKHSTALGGHHWPALRAVLARFGAATDWRLAVLLGLCAVLFALVAQLPFRYAFQVGIDRGPRSDLPFVAGFLNPELVTWDDSWRWSRPEAEITVPGIGQRGVVVDFDVVSHRAQWQPDAPPTVLTLDTGIGQPTAITLRPEGARYQVYLPPDALRDGTLRLRLTTPAWQNPADSRGELGVALGRVLTITSTSDAGLVLPDLRLLLGWTLGLGLCWLLVCVLGFPPRTALLLLLPLALALPALAITEAPRMGFGDAWVVQAGLIGLATATVTGWLVPPLLARFGALPAPVVLRWLLLLVVVHVVVKYGGQLYPDAMPGDLQLHVNRYSATMYGQVYIPAQHRGLPFPFPNGPYILLAPFTLTGINVRFWFESTAALFDASTILLFYLTLARLTGSQRLGLIAATTYALTAVSFMNTWFSFQTQVATQWLSVLLLTVLVLRWPRYNDWPTWSAITVLFALVFLGHIGSFLNTALVGVLVVPVLWWRAPGADERRGVRWLLGAGLAAAAFVGLFYYTAFWGLISQQLVGVASEGLNELTGKNPIPRAETLAVLWSGGMITHYGLFPVLLAALGVALLALGGRLRRSILPPLVWLIFAVALTQAVLPLITLSSITTRWLTFAGWAITVASAFAVLRLWRRGWSARLVTVAMFAFVAWQAVVVWIEAMALRQPPIEPF